MVKPNSSDLEWSLAEHELPARESEPDDEAYYENRFLERVAAARRLGARPSIVALDPERPGRKWQCLSPGSLTRAKDGSWNYSGPWHSVFRSLDPMDYRPDRIPVPCHTCLVCKANSQRDLVIRATHEARLADGPSWFGTFTFSEEHLPEDGSLHHEIFAGFMKRARRRFEPFRMSMCGEYGETRFRAHYHALLFGLMMPDVRRVGEKLYSSSMLNEAWGLGLVHLGVAEHASIRYVSGYVSKKLSFSRGVSRVENRMVALPGNLKAIRPVKPEYGLSSRNPGLGAKFADNFYKQVFESGTLWLDGKEVSRIPAYYRRRWAAGMAPSEPGGERVPFPGYDLFLEKRVAKAQAAGDPLSVEELARLGATIKSEQVARKRDGGKRKL